MKAVYILQNNKKLNAREFIYYFEHKVLFTIRKYNLLNKKQKQDLDVKNLLKKDKIAKTLVSYECLDDIALKILTAFMEKDIKKLKELMPVYQKNKKKIIRPFYLISKKEIELYCKLKGIKQLNKRDNINKDNSEKISLWLNSLEIEHPEVKNAIVNSLLKIEKFI